ncbi:HAD family hydrolase [Idiomarina sp. 29L]|uniref:HAD family hydrolase n=1 Tax=Idiomarina sp. 29L TaxID=2508877 RepID=UPI001011F745|nr:HAD family hydrolase [Idiomarina sp. 29L]RXS43244.1 HAD family hydrolase [Idiomarina sp. 29L]
MNLALFDFDGTITTRDTYTKFVFSSTKFVRLVIGALLLFPAITLYKARLLSAPKIRPLISRVAFMGVPEKQLDASAERFVSEYLPSVIRSDMLQKIAKHKENGDHVVIVSASISPYLKIWCKRHEVDLICSELEVRNGRLTGAYLNGDCSNERKVARIKERINLSLYSKVFAYGDSEEDYPMLNLANTSFYRGELFEVAPVE